MNVEAAMDESIMECMISCETPSTSEVSGLGKELPNGYEEGKKLFSARCAVCHGEKGQPQISIYPPIKNSSFLMNNQDKIPCVIRYGLKGAINVNGKSYDMKMASNPDLSAEEISQLINYMNNSWGNTYGSTTTEDVINVLENCNRK